MENHGKYNQFIFTHRQDSLYVNLFIASELNWKNKNVRIRQETKFPFDEEVTLKVTEGNSQFTLMIRYPFWVKEGALKITINGKPYPSVSKPSSYVSINRKWKKGDDIRIVLPMHTRLEQLPNVPNYVAVLNGPILLAARTGTEDLKGLMANDGRWAHIASGKRLPIDKAPIIIEESVPEILKAGRGQTLDVCLYRYQDGKPDNGCAGAILSDSRFEVHDVLDGSKQA
jgi:DUF1680 family protein